MSEDVELLRRVIDEQLAGHRPPVEATVDDRFQDDWKLVREAGWHRIGIGPQAGGDGGEVTDVAAVVERLAANAVSVPLLEHHLAAWLLECAGSPAVQEGRTWTIVAPSQREPLLTLMRDGSGAMRLQGTLPRVPWARHADHLAAYVRDENRDAVAMLDLHDPQLVIEHGENLAGEPRDRIDFRGYQVDTDQVISAPLDRTHVQLRSAMLSTAALCGAMERAHRLSVEHARTREQFGRPIARFELIQAHLARMSAEITLARHVVDRAVQAHLSNIDRLVHTASAKLAAINAGTTVAALSHQIHGAMGVTLEHPLHHSTLRLLSWRDEWGQEADWAHALGRYAGELGPEEFWAVLAL